MRIRHRLKCADFPCSDVNLESHVFPGVDVDAGSIRLVMISEAPPPDLKDYLYAKGNPLQAETTLAAFNDAGIDVSSMKELLKKGVYVTSALKCGKIGYGVSAKSIENCSLLLEKELALFPNVDVFMLMGDIAIKAMNYVGKRQTGKRIIPAGSTYKIRKQKFSFQGKRVFPSYLQAGPAFYIEKSKRRMIKEDLRAALSLLKCS